MHTGVFSKGRGLTLLLFASIAWTGLYDPTRADEQITTTDGRRFLLRSDGTYAAVGAPSSVEPNSYKAVQLDDLKLDIESMTGQKIQVTALVGTFGDVVSLNSVEEAFDANPIIADQKTLSRDDRKFLLQQCKARCTAVARGTITSTMFGTKLALGTVRPVTQADEL